MTTYTLIEIVAVGGSAAGLIATLWVLLKAMRDGRIVMRMGVVARDEHPRWFRLLIGFYSVACLVLLVTGGTAAHRLASGATAIGRSALSLPPGLLNSQLPWALAGLLSGLAILVVLRTKR